MPQHYNPHKIFASYFTGCESLAFALTSKLAEGHICIDIENYTNELPGILEEESAKESFTEADKKFRDPEAFRKQCENGEYVTTDPEVLKPFIVQNGKAYLQRYYRYETDIIRRIRELGEHFRIITGGPGTGKTYGVAQELVRIFAENANVSVALAAPTGKAAARMNESLSKFANDPENKITEPLKKIFDGLKASTLHRLLVPVKDSAFFRFNEHNRLPYQVIIVDECSMVDGPMMAKLLNAVDDHTKVFMLGDRDQLASVEAGSIFGDLCRLKDTELLKNRIEVKTKSWRFDPDKGIGRFSKEVIEGRPVRLEEYKNDKQITIDTSFSSQLFREQALLFKEYIEEEDIAKALEKLNNIRFLCVTRENEFSVEETNAKIEKILREEYRGTDLFAPGKGFYHNQPIIVTRNDYSLNLFNGDVGLIRKEGDILFAYFEDAEKGIKPIQAGYLNYYQTVFAMTIHKSQGSEFTNVVVILPEKQGEKLLTRELLYTGVTRAMDHVLVQSTEEVLKKCIEQGVSRASGLANQIKQD